MKARDINALAVGTATEIANVTTGEFNRNEIIQIIARALFAVANDKPKRHGGCHVSAQQEEG
jgi:hypothetical protein